MSHLITDAQARRIAAEWHGGQRSALCSLATTGYLDRDQLHTEIAGEIRSLEQNPDHYEDPDYLRIELRALDNYVAQRPNAATVPGWHNLWDDHTCVTADQT